jgi:threonine/homoserine/homoserine lactone efflux protein
MSVSEFVLAALLLELTPGPNMAYLATLSLARGRASGFAATAGVAFGLSVHAILAALGAGVLIQRFALIYEGTSLDRRRLSSVPRLGRLAKPSRKLAEPR